jgi:archaellum component FlaC
MFNPNFDPMEILEQLQVQTMSHDASIDELQERLKQLSHLVEMVATQTKHLTTAIIGLQNQNKILHTRIERLEQVND